MKKFLFLFFCSILSFPLWAQNNLVVRDFKYLQYDQTANLKGTSKKDNNGKTAALIKIETTLDNLAFDGGSYGIVTTEHKTGQWWVYVPQRAQKLTIRHPKYGKCEYYYEDEIKAARTYTMKLNLEGKNISFVTSVPGSEVMVDDEKIGKSPLTTYLSYGIHRVSIKNKNMYYDGNITVSKEGQNQYNFQMLDENDLYGTITVKVDNGADIYYNGEKVGAGSWYTRQKAGTYILEARKKNSETVSTTVEVVAKQDKTVKINAPIPYTGYLKVDLTPKTAGIYLDDKLLTESNVCNLPIGRNSITFAKKGYRSIIKTYNIPRDKEVNDTIKLKPLTYIKETGFYAGVAFCYNSMMGISGTLGFVFKNIDIQASYIMGLTKSDEVYWYDYDTRDELGACTYKMNQMAFKLGYQFPLSKSIGITPQVGYLTQMLSSSGVDYGSKAICSNLTVGVKLNIAPMNHLCFFLNPEYAIPMKKSETFASIAKVADFTEGGFYGNVGLLVNF